MINSLKRLKIYLSKELWVLDTGAMTRFRARYIQALRIGYLIVRDAFFDSQLNLRAMSLVYTTLLSLVPLLAVSVSVLKGFGAHVETVTMLSGFLERLGDDGEKLTAQIVEFVDRINIGLLGSLGLALLVYAVISLMQKIEHAFNFTWHLSEDRSFARRFSDYLSVILIGPVLVFTAMGITASLTSSVLFQKLLTYPVTAAVLGTFSVVIPYILVILAFTLVYVLIPNTRVRFGPAIIGAAIAGFLWEVVGWFFASFIASANYKEIYSAFAALFFFLIWLYLSWSILLIGASIAFYIQHPEQCTPKARGLVISNRMKEKLALAIMAQVVTQYYQKKEPLSLQQLAKNMNVTTRPVKMIIDTLMDSNLLIKTEHEPSEYVPAAAPEAITALDILSSVRTAEEDNYINLDRLPDFLIVNEAFSKYQDVASEVLGSISLKDLVLEPVNKHKEDK